MGKEEIQESEPLRIYLNEIGEIPLLDETEEKELGRRISDGGKYSSDIRTAHKDTYTEGY